MLADQLLGAKTYFWNPAVQTLKALYDSVTGTSTAPAVIYVPPGTYTTTQLGASLALKPWVNLKGAGGRGRVTIFSGITLTMADASIPAGVNRWRMDGIRLESSPINLLCTTAGHTLVATLDDCPLNGNSPIITKGNAYGSGTTMVNLEIRDMNIDKNAAPQLFELSRVSFYSSNLLGMLFKDSDAYFLGCDLSSGCNVVNDAASAGGWFEFSGCKIDTMALNDPTSESVLATLCGSGNENVQVNCTMRGAADPNGIANWARFQAGALYFRFADAKLYRKTTDVGVNTWVASNA
jgi:hypothetical protein